MKSKSFDLSREATVKLEHNKTFDFVDYYPTAAETKSPQKKQKSNENQDIKSESPKREKSPHKRNRKKKQAVDVSQVYIEGPAAVSTPLASNKGDKVKSIMKNSSVVVDDAMDGSPHEVATSKPKKRNKSVSFMLEENEEVVVKKTKSEDSLDVNPTQPRVKANKLRNIKKMKKNKQAEKENKINDINKSTDVENTGPKKDKGSKDKQENSKNLLSENNTEDATSDNTHERKKRKHLKKTKKQDDNQTDIKQVESDKPKKANKKKREAKSQTDTENEEPAIKSRKKDIKPEVIAEDLENLSIGDNAHTLSNLLDEMTVADKDKRKKLRKRVNKSKKEKGEETNTGEEVKEKKWKRKRWNKEKKEIKEGLATSVLVENLPLSMLFSYKKVLSEHFARCGLLRNVGIAEVYPTEVSVPVFTTTIYFDNEEAASKALEEDKTLLEGNTIHVKRPLPASETTAVVRSYGPLTEQGISSAFAGAGRIRAIRLTAKGKKSISTAFVEFDGPASVDNAIKMASDVKIGGKKIHVSKYEIRKKKVDKSSENVASDADQSDNS